LHCRKLADWTIGLNRSRGRALRRTPGLKDLAIFLGRSPDTAAAEDLRLFQLHLTETHVRPPTINGTATALRFFFSVTADRSAVTNPMTFVAQPREIPVILSAEEVARFLEAAPEPKYKAALSADYGAGLRVQRSSR
jgi:integrase/recombinase XerD